MWASGGCRSSLGARSCVYYVPGGPEERADNLGSRWWGLELKVLRYLIAELNKQGRLGE